VSRAQGVFARGKLTDYLLAQLTDRLTGTAVLVGDGVAPKAGGWQGGQPGQGAFAPYVVLSTGEASSNSPQPLGQANADDWVCQYTLRSVGGLRKQADYAADVAIYVWNVFGALGEELDLGMETTRSWKLYRSDVLRMGPVTRNDEVDPALWEMTANLAVYLTKSRT
jgi:hypothetical protein